MGQGHQTEPRRAGARSQRNISERIQQIIDWAGVSWSDDPMTEWKGQEER